MLARMETTKYFLNESALRSAGTTSRLICRSLCPVPAPGNDAAARPEDLLPLFPMELILQEVTMTFHRYPAGSSRDLPPLATDSALRAHALEAAIGTRSRIFYKHEGVSPAARTSRTRRSPGFLQQEGGRTRIATETGAASGQRACVRLQADGLECMVYMVRVSYEQKPFRRSLITPGRQVVASPSDQTTPAARFSRTIPR